MKKSKLLMLKLCYPINNDNDLCSNYVDGISLRMIYLIEKAYFELKIDFNTSEWVIY
jgi:hypothetical protein